MCKATDPMLKIMEWFGREQFGKPDPQTWNGSETEQFLFFQRTLEQESQKN